jgi:signal transduction histidine kinase
MKKRVGKWFFLFSVVIAAVMVIIWLSYLNINTRVVNINNGSMTLSAADIAGGFTLLDGQLLVSDGHYLPSEVDAADWRFSSNLRFDSNIENKTYRLSVSIADGSDICFLVSQPTNIRFWINGIELPERDLESDHIYHFSEFNTADNNEYQILIQVDESISRRDHYHGLIFGSQEQLINVLMAWVSSGMIAIGVWTLLLIQCLALFIQKRSERYLLILALIIVQAGLRGIEISIFPLLSIFFPGAQLSELARALFRITLPLNLLLLTVVFPKEVGRKEWVAGTIICIVGLICTVARLWGIRSIALYSNQVEQAMLFLETYCILKSYLHNRYGSHVLLVGVFGYIIGRVFASLIALSIVPIGIVDAYYYPWQYANLIYLISYMVAIDGIFARKFSEANILSEKLRQVNVNLEQIVAERTSELEEINHKLVESNQSLIKFQQAKQEFLGNVVHNLRTPLFTMAVTVEMLQEESKAYPQFSLLLIKILEKVELIQHMIKDLLFVVRIDDGKIDFDLKRQDLNVLLTQICLDYQSKVEQKSLSLQLDLPGKPTPVAFDGLYLRQAIENILDNAIRYSIPGKPIFVSVTMKGEVAQIQIENFGEQISAEDIPHIFERYYRGKDSKPDQTGLGLAIAQEILVKHEGTISVKSDQAGSCFNIYLQAID